jgi:type III secretory pathway component EscS
MTPDALHHLLHEAAMAMAVGGGILVGSAALAGFLVAFLQSATQIQDQTLPLLAKIGTAAIILYWAFGALTAPLMAYTRLVFDFARLVP